jgi:glucose-6-phosphate isomerase
MIEINPVVITHDKEFIAAMKKEIEHITQELKQGYDTPYGALIAPSDSFALEQVRQMVNKIKKLNPDLLMLCGIGGSNMGTLALLQALGYTAKMRFMCADTIDERYTSELIAQFRTLIEQGQIPLVCIITKSGTTAETIINGALFIEVLKELLPDTYKQHIVIISDQGSPLYRLAVKEEYNLLEIPKQVGGRYSVFTAVGLFPLMLLGMDVEGLCRGAQDALRSCLNTAIEVNETALTTLSLFEHYKHGYQIHNLFVFSPYLVLLAEWYKQLIGESLGKKDTVDGKKVEIGFTPVVSLGTTDLHSVGQLYLSGPRNTITSFITFDDEEKRVIIPHNNLSELLPGMAGRSLTSVKGAIVEGTITAYNKEKRPSIVHPLKQTSESIGAFLLSKMVETILLGSLWNINPFDQPGVELYKRETRDILST